MAPVPLTQSNDGNVEKLISQLSEAISQMSKFNYETMMNEVRRMIQESTVAEAPEPIPQTQEATNAVPEQTDIAEAEAASTAEQPETEDDTSFSLNNDFDIMDLLAQAMETNPDNGTIEMLLASEEDMVVVNLEELSHYVRKLAKA